MATILDVLTTLSNGHAHDLADEALREITQAVLDTGKAGTLTIKIEVKLNGERTVSLSPTISTKTPQHSMGQTIFFAQDNGDLSRSDPQQRDLPLREVEPVRKEVRELT